MRNRSKGNKTIEISLNEEKFYFPGETIKGIVTVHPKSPTKTNQIRIKFTGEITLSVKDKEVIQLFQKTQVISVSKDKQSKAQVLEAREHRFPFEFNVPDDDTLPSSMEFGKRKTRISYTLTAIHDRPMVPESLCAKAEYVVPILEFIDVADQPYTTRQDRALEIMLPKAKVGQKCHLRVSMPGYGFTRGDVVSLTIALHNYEQLSRKNGIKVELIRATDIRTARNTLSKEDILKFIEYDIDVSGPRLSQEITSQLLIPTSTPPTVSYKEKILNIQYKVRIKLYLEKKSTETEILDMPIIVGTWPRATIPIDDDDDDDYDYAAEKFGDMTLGDDDDGSNVASPTTDGNPLRKSSLGPITHRRNASSSMLSVASSTSSAIQPPTRSNSNFTGTVGRSDSVASKSSNRSHGSESSWRSSQSYDNYSLSRNTSLKSMTTMTEMSSPYSYNPSTSMTPANAYNKGPSHGQAYVGRSSSTYDQQMQPSGNVYNPMPLAHNRVVEPPPRLQSRSPAIDQDINYQYSNHRSSSSYHHPTASYNQYSFVPQPNLQHQPLAEYPMPPTNPNYTMQTHILAPVQHAGAPTTNPPSIQSYNPAGASPSLHYNSSHPQEPTGMYHGNRAADANRSGGLDQSSDSADSDDDDLFAILERKKKQEERDLRKRQQMIYSSAE